MWVHKIFGSLHYTISALFIVGLGCTPYSAAIALVVFWPFIASKATFALIWALYRFLGMTIFSSSNESSSIQSFYLIAVSKFWGIL